MNPQKLVAELIRLKIAKQDEIFSVSEDSLADVERKLGKNLPIAYRDFLKSIGGGAGMFWNDQNYTVNKLAKINLDFEEDIELLRGDGYTLDIPEGAFAIAEFSEHTMFIDLDDNNEKCPVYDLNVFKGEYMLANESLWERVESCLRDFEGARSKKSSDGLER